MKKATKLTKKQRRAARAAASARGAAHLEQPIENSSGQSSDLPWQTVARRRRLQKPSPSPSAEASTVDAVTSNRDMAGRDGLRSTKPSSASKGRRVACGDAKQPIHKVATTPKAIRSWVSSQQGSAVGQSARLGSLLFTQPQV